jgi:hypothetical protein
MGRFRREGTFRDRGRFLEGVRAEFDRLLGGPAQGMTQTWERRDGADVARVSGFGVRLELVVEEARWTMEAEIPSWLPIPQKAIEEKFDAKFSELGRL